MSSVRHFPGTGTAFPEYSFRWLPASELGHGFSAAIHNGLVANGNWRKRVAAAGVVGNSLTLRR